MTDRAFERRFLPLVILTAVMLLPGVAQAQQGTVTDDAYTSSSSQNSNNGSASSLSVGMGFKTTTSTYIKFKLTTSLPSGTTTGNVAKATLKLYVSSLSVPGSFDVYRVTGSWNEGTITQATAPSLGGLEAYGVPVSVNNAFVAIDVTQLVKDWLSGSANGGIANNGIAIVPNTSGAVLAFDSKESNATSHEPRLEIILVNQGPQGPAGPIGPSGPQGLKGDSATGSQGAAGQGYNWRGNWDTATDYVAYDTVFYDGSSYLAVASSTGIAPGTNTTKWSMMAQQGAASNSPAVTSITGTPDQILASASTGAVTLSLPQPVGVASAPTFSGLKLNGPSFLADGSTSSPSIGFGNESAMGVFRPSASRMDFVTNGLTRAFLTRRVPGDQLTNSANPPNAGFFAVQGPNAGDFLGMTFFNWGANIIFRNSSNELEFHGWNGQQYQPILSLVTGSFNNQIHLRNRADTNAMVFFFRDYGGASIETEQPSTPISIAPTADLTLSPGSHIVEQRDKTSPQAFRIYNSYIDGGNFERGFTRWVNNVFEVGTDNWGSGVGRAMSFVTGLNRRWIITADGHFVPALDNYYDIGQNGFARVRNIYAAGNINSDSSITANSLGLGAPSTVTWTKGSGSPSGSCVTGSIYSRTDGGSGSTLYVCEAGNWAAK